MPEKESQEVEAIESLGNTIRNTTGDVVDNDGYGWAVGAGFNWGGLTADYELGNGGFLMDPVSYITGNNSNGATNQFTSQTVTLTYSF